MGKMSLRRFATPGIFPPFLTTVFANIRRVRASPTDYTSNAPLSMTPIASGTFVNATHMSYTFLCSGCITNDAMTFDSSASTINLGWSLANAAVTNPGSAEGASFMYHSVGDGQYSLDLDAAKSSQYESWAAAAAGSGSSASTSTVSSTPTPASTSTAASTATSKCGSGRYWRSY